MTGLPYVAMIIPDGSNQFFSRIAQLVQRELSQSSTGLVLFDSDGSSTNELAYIRWISQQWRKESLSALIYIPTGDNLDNFEEVFRLELPIVVMDREVPEDFSDRAIDQVLASNRTGMRLIIEHLADIGVDKVAYIQGPKDTEPGRVRNNAFREYWEARYGTTPVAVFEGDFSFESGRSLGEAILRLADKPNAVVAANDLMALGVMQVLQRSGLKVPDDVVVVGYDDIPLANWVYPTLTTVRQDVEEMARQAAAHAMRRIGGDRGSGGLRTPILPELVIRESSSLQ